MPLDEDTIRTCRERLEALIGELQRTLEDSAESARPVELDQPAMGRVSRIDAIQQQKMTEANRASQRSRLSLARSALQRLESGDFGECLACGEEIGDRRLVARPESLYCVDCQRERERS